jgi:DNA polymerase III epsilon subunit-like protein
MLNFNKLCVFDFETTGKDPNFAQPCSMAGVMIDPRKLTICDNGIFYSLCNIIPDEEVDKYNLRPVEQKAMQTNKLSLDDIKKAPPLKKVWGDFGDWVNFHNPEKDKWAAPILCGQNVDYDKTIKDRIVGGHLRGEVILPEKLVPKTKLTKLEDDDIRKEYKKLVPFKEPYKFGPDRLFHPIYQLDTIQFSFAFFESCREPHKLGLDIIKDFLGFAPTGAHNALVDALYTAEILIRYLKVIREVSKETDFCTSNTTILPIQSIIDSLNPCANKQEVELCPF